ncbi:hypothetical protein JQ625_18350 [Bradyrhizobium diazoefficiens]|nr:hypothetical protein [Bradyrhizobium diazoefficiens]MBR0776801.1 hypothetical protein [Bradyrhizobium diazoefficiens]
MPKDPIWVDTCTLVNISKGDFALELELQQLRAQGHELLIVPAVRHELFQGNPLTASPKKPQWQQVPRPADQIEVARAANRLGIKVDLSTNVTTMQSRVRRAWQDHLPRHGEFKGVSKYVDVISQSDSQVLAEIKISAEIRGVTHPVVFTAEEGGKAMVTQTHLFGVTSMTRKTPKPPSAPKPPKPPAGGGGGAPGGGGGGGPPKFTLSEYPPDKELSIVRFFKDRPMLRQVGLTAATNAVALFQIVLSDYIASHCGGANAELCSAMDEVAALSNPSLPLIPHPLQVLGSHFDGALTNAYREFAEKFPDVRSLAVDLRLDGCRAAYDAALSKLQEPSRARALGATMVALSPPQKQAAVWQEVQKRLSTVKLANGATGSYGQAASASIDAMAELMTRLAKHSKGLPEIADEIGRRAAALHRAGEETEQAFRMLMPFALPVPLGFYALSDLHIWASTFNRYGDSLGALAAELHGRADEYEKMAAALDKELIKVSEEMNRYAP